MDPTLEAKSIGSRDNYGVCRNVVWRTQMAENSSMEIKAYYGRNKNMKPPDMWEVVKLHLEDTEWFDI